METEHIVKAFDEELGLLDKIIAEMGGLAEAQLADAISALVRRDAKAAHEVVRNDARVDELEARVDAFAIRLLALRQPVADDLRVVLAALKIASDLERIGDYAKNVAKRTTALAQGPEIEGMAHSLTRMGRLVQGMIKNVLDAYVARDMGKADDVRARDEEVDQLHTSLFRELLTYMMEDPRNITACTHLLFVAKNVERIGDHATNIAEHVHFMVGGERPGDHRRKDDRSSFTVVSAPDADTA